jgi:hypothetical protein
MLTYLVCFSFYVVITLNCVDVSLNRRDLITNFCLQLDEKYQKGISSYDTH